MPKRKAINDSDSDPDPKAKPVDTERAELNKTTDGNKEEAVETTEVPATATAAWTAGRHSRRACRIDLIEAASRAAWTRSRCADCSSRSSN